MKLKRRCQIASQRWWAGVFALALASLLVRPIDAAILVDPQNTGATDVGFTYTVPSNLLTNPVPDPLIAPPGGGGVGLLIVGHSSNGEMTIDGGSQATITQIWMGHDAGTHGNLTVTGANSKLSDPVEIRVGLAGTGSLKVLDGALVETEQVYADSSVLGIPSEVIVDGASTKLLLSDGLFVGGSKLSTVTTSNGASLEANRVDLGFYAGTLDAVNQASVSTGGRWKVAGDLDVGTNGGGMLTIASAGEVEAFRTTLGSFSSPASPPLQLDGGTLRTTELYFPANSIAGIGSIFAKGLVADLDIAFDAAHGLVQTIPIAGQPGVSLELDQSGAGVLGVGYSQDGTLTIADGRQVQSDSGYLAYFTGSHGTAHVTGAGSKWSISGDLAVGRGGVGVLNIGAGATVEVAGLLQINQTINNETSHVMLNGGELRVNVLAAASNQFLGQGTVHANGVHLDSTLVFDQPGVFDGTLPVPGQQVTIAFDQPVLSLLGAGLYGSGSVEIRNGAQVQSHDGALGKELNSHGTAIVDGIGSEWTIEAGELRLGYPSGGHARGTLQVVNGGFVDSYNVRLYSDSSIEVGGAGSRLAAYFVQISTPSTTGIPTLRVHSGGIVSIYDARISGSDRINGRIVVEGAGSVLRFGYRADLQGGLVVVRDGGLLAVGGEATGGTRTLGLLNGVLQLDGGTIDVGGGDVYLGNAQFQFVDGLLRNFRSFNGNLAHSAGRVELGTIQSTIDGSYFCSRDATLEIPLYSSSNSTQTRMRVLDAAVLEGTLEVDVAPTANLNFLPGSTYLLMHANFGISGAFQEYVLPSLGTGLSWSLVQLDTDLSLQVIAGDFNRDGTIDAADYTLWRDSLGKSVAAGSGADGDRNGFIGQNDLQIWKQFYGRKILASRANMGSGGANSLAVPEPVSIFLVLSGLLATVARRR